MQKKASSRRLFFGPSYVAAEKDRLERQRLLELALASRKEEEEAQLDAYYLCKSWQKEVQLVSKVNRYIYIEIHL
jgi:hypothetical protein